MECYMATRKSQLDCLNFCSEFDCFLEIFAENTKYDLT
jgi:hypothetical protein